MCVGILGGLAFGVAILVAEAAGGTYSELSDRSSLTLISVSAQSAATTPTPITPQVLQELRSFPHVVAVYPWVQTGLSVEDNATPVIVWATATAPELVPQCLSKYPCPSVLDDHSIVLPASVNGYDMTQLAGSSVTFSYEQLVARNGSDMQGATKNVNLHVVGFYDPADAKVDGLAAAFVSLDNAVAWQAAYKGMTPSQFTAAGYDQVFLKADSAQDASAVVGELAAHGIAGTSYFALTHELPQALRLIQSFSLMLGCALLMVCALVGTSLGSGIALSQRRVVGLLKAMGWTTPQVARSLLGEVALLGLLVGVIAVVVGFLVGFGVMAALGGRTFGWLTIPTQFALPSPWWVVGCAIGPPLATAMGALFRVLRTASIAPDDALRDL